MALLKSKTLQGLIGGTIFEWLGIDLVARLEMAGLMLHKDWAKLKILRRARRDRWSMVTNFESFIVHSIASGMAKSPGDIAEVGVYAGSTAKVICEAKGDKKFHLCDTFEGLPEPGEDEKKVEKKGRYFCSIESIQEYLKQYPNLEYHKGFCPASVEGKLDDTKFCFVHLDVDLYESTKQCLEYFFPRLIPGGVLLSHDYSILEGVKKAFSEFCDGRTEQVIEMPTTQAMLVKGL